MKILVCTGIYPPDIGGPATYSKLLFDELPKRGIGVEILSFGEVRRLPKIIRHLAYFLKVLKRARGVDLVFAQDPVSVGLPAALAAKLSRKKLVLKVVGDYAWEQFQQSAAVRRPPFVSLEEFQKRKFDWLTELRRKIERWVARQADKIIVPSEYLKGIISIWLSDSQMEKIAVIYNAFSAPELKISKEEAREKIAGSRRLLTGGFLIISAGRLVPWKGFGLLIEIMPEIIKKIPDAKLYIIGDGPERKALESLIANLGLQNNVFLLGQLLQEKVLSYLGAGDLFVLNTGYEGFSHQILEAMAMGVPIITTDVGGNPEIIEDNKNGLLVEHNNQEQLKEAIIKLYKDKDLREKFIKNTKEKVKEFNKEKMIKETIKILL